MSFPTQMTVNYNNKWKTLSKETLSHYNLYNALLIKEIKKFNWFKNRLMKSEKADSPSWRHLERFWPPERVGVLRHNGGGGVTVLLNIESCIDPPALDHSLIFVWCVLLPSWRTQRFLKGFVRCAGRCRVYLPVQNVFEPVFEYCCCRILWAQVPNGSDDPRGIEQIADRVIEQHKGDSVEGQFPRPHDPIEGQGV